MSAVILESLSDDNLERVANVFSLDEISCHMTSIHQTKETNDVAEQNNAAVPLTEEEEREAKQTEL